MKHPERVEDFLEHIVEAIDRATAHLQPIPDSAALERNPLVQDAVIRNLEIIGEAATQLGQMDPEFYDRHHALPWQEMRRTRNKIAHGYFDVEWETVWNTVKTDLPPLKQQIRALLLERKRQQEQEQEQRQRP